MVDMAEGPVEAGLSPILLFDKVFKKPYMMLDIFESIDGHDDVQKE